MFELLQTIDSEELMIFLHPHYGVGNEHYHDTGHALFLALGFPFETTVAVSRLILSGKLDQIPNLKLLVAHAGAALPSLIGRLDSCVEHDTLLCNKLEHLPSHYFKKFYYDAISYSDVSLRGLIEHLNDHPTDNQYQKHKDGVNIGTDRIMFGTDNPFFPPLDLGPENDCTKVKWPSTVQVQETIQNTLNDTDGDKLLYKNAAKILNINL